MPTGSAQSDVEKTRIMLGLLESVERDGGLSQRRLAAELGIALGLVNAYLKRCVNKGLLKVKDVPARRYAYYLTPQGFAEKSRLTVEYLSISFGFFRQAKADFAVLFSDARARGFSRLAVAGRSDLAEIASICAVESAIEIVAVVDVGAETGAARFIGLPVVGSFDAIEQPVDGVIVTDLNATQRVTEAALAHFGVDRVLVPSLLRIRMRAPEEMKL